MEGTVDLRAAVSPSALGASRCGEMAGGAGGPPQLAVLAVSVRDAPVCCLLPHATRSPPSLIGLGAVDGLANVKSSAPGLRWLDQRDEAAPGLQPHSRLAARNAVLLSVFHSVRLLSQTDWSKREYFNYPYLFRTTPPFSIDWLGGPLPLEGAVQFVSSCSISPDGRLLVGYGERIESALAWMAPLAPLLAAMQNIGGANQQDDTENYNDLL